MCLGLWGVGQGRGRGDRRRAQGRCVCVMWCLRVHWGGGDRVVQGARGDGKWA